MTSSSPDNFQRASEEDRERFSYGQCMWFALAVHGLTGWPIEAVLDEAGSIDHAWVRMPDGRSFDVAGPGGAEDFIRDPSQVQTLARAQLIQLAGGDIDAEAVAHATAVFRAMDGGATRRDKPAQVAGIRSYFGGFLGPPDRTLTQRYMRGDCGHFALAMASKVEGGRLWEVGIGHFAVEDGRGQYWDVRGAMTLEQLWSGLAGAQMMARTRDEVIETLNGGVYRGGPYSPWRERQAKTFISQLMGLKPRRRAGAGP